MNRPEGKEIRKIQARQCQPPRELPWEPSDAAAQAKRAAGPALGDIWAPPALLPRLRPAPFPRVVQSHTLHVNEAPRENLCESGRGVVFAHLPGNVLIHC